jgi:hypothetical protein
MVALAIPLLEMAAEAIAAGWSAFISSGAATAIAGGAATATVFALPGDSAQDKAKAEAQANTRTREQRCKCPPEQGAKVQNTHSMNPKPRRYQARITGFEYGIVTDGKGQETRAGWNMEWTWLGTSFDGFVKAQCLLQEAKDDYDQFLDEDDDPVFWFGGFKDMADTIALQSKKVRVNPPAKLMWYFGTPRARDYMMPTLIKNGVPSVYQP